jgi:hypothetical protein
LSVSALAVDRGNYLYAGTFLGGVYRSLESVVTVSNREDGVLPSQFVLYQNYPDPFNPSTSISFSTPKHTHVGLHVFNSLGQLIITLVDQDKQPGTYTIKWDASNRPSGVYFYRMTAGDYTLTKKAMMAK